MHKDEDFRNLDCLDQNWLGVILIMLLSCLGNPSLIFKPKCIEYPSWTQYLNRPESDNVACTL